MPSVVIDVGIIGVRSYYVAVDYLCSSTNVSECILGMVIGGFTCGKQSMELTRVHTWKFRFSVEWWMGD